MIEDIPYCSIENEYIKEANEWKRKYDLGGQPAITNTEKH